MSKTSYTETTRSHCRTNMSCWLEIQTTNTGGSSSVSLGKSCSTGVNTLSTDHLCLQMLKYFRKTADRTVRLTPQLQRAFPGVSEENHCTADRKQPEKMEKNVLPPTDFSVSLRYFS